MSRQSQRDAVLNALQGGPRVKGQQKVLKSVCRKTQGIAEPGNSCLTTPGTCESCPDWAKQPYERKESSREELLKMVRKLFKENLKLKRQTYILRELKEWLKT